MNLRFKPVCCGGSRYRQVRSLYRQAFPEAEQLPLWLLTMLAWRRDVDFYAVCDGDDCCGLLYLLRDGDHTLIFYFAVRADLRSRGYGAQILAWVRGRSRTVSLIMESMREPCDNAEQRLRRRDFYLRNGFQDTGYYMKSLGLFDILCTEPAIEPVAYRKLVSRPMFWRRRMIEVGKF